MSEDHSFHMNLRIMNCYVILEANTEDEKEKVNSIISPYKISEHLSNIYYSSNDILSDPLKSKTRVTSYQN